MNSQPDLALILREIHALRAELQTPAPRLLSLNQAAGYLGLAPRTVRNELSRKIFPVKPVRHGGKILFKRTDLDAYVDSLGVGE
jgi:excisionase family DNA binding protein